MKSPGRLLSLLPALGALAAAAPAAAQDDAPEGRPNTTYFFECQGPAPLQNGTSSTTPRTWTTSPPAGSLQGGAGCAFADPAISGASADNGLYDAVFGGGATERVRSAIVTLYDSGPSSLAFNLGANVAITVDGAAATPVAGVPLDLPVQTTPFAGVRTVQFGIVFRSELLERFTPRQFRIGVKNRFLNVAPVWTAGAKEAPASIELNPRRKLPAQVVTL